MVDSRDGAEAAGVVLGKLRSRVKAAPGKLLKAKNIRDEADEFPGVVRVPGWEKFPWLVAGFSARQGGVSAAYGDGELNLGWTAEDAEANVVENRRRLVQAVAGVSEFELATVRQFHSGMIRVVERGHGPLATENGRAVLRGDGSLTDVPGVLLGVQTADCVPVLVVDVKQRVVGAFHAGWRGTVARIVERGVGTMRLRYGSKPKDLVAAVGPAIGACCFAVGAEVRDEFESQFAYAPELFSDIGPQTHADLFEANRRQLVDAGVSAKKVTVVGECSACTRLPDGRRKYFSHRAEKGFTGRMMSVVGVKKEVGNRK